MRTTIKAAGPSPPDPPPRVRPTRQGDQSASRGPESPQEGLLGAILDSVAHDLRNHLTTILGAATTLLEFQAVLPAEARTDLLQAIQEEAGQLNGYVSRLLDARRLRGAGACEQPSLDVREVARHVVRAGVRARTGRTLVCRLPRILSLARGDRTLLEGALDNVVRNALAYGPVGSRVTVSVWEEPRAVCLSVSDEGAGFPGADPERLFERLRRGGAAGAGCGLGLAIAKSFMQAMSGEITLGERRGGGAEVILRLAKA
ncbi:sensor histidine kinase [Caulobacter sp. KR2-114]|uniref:sensor histidine kinase n=1 Tax=Caulobacter sp. KR2-114 TaxID=3400912 RepID=UPI003C0B1FC6